MDRPNPAEYQPPLTRWMRIWRFAAMLLISGVVWGPTIQHQFEDHPGLFWTDLVLGIAAYVAVRYRRRYPLAIALALAAVGAVSGLAAGPATLAAVSLATRRRWRELGPVFAVSAVGAQVYTTLQPGQSADPAWVLAVLNVVVILAMLAWGMYVGSRRELIWTLRNRAERAEAEQDLRVAQARSQEQARIAREMHDVLAHRISQIAMHAGALEYRDDLTTEEMRESAAVIRDKAHEALNDLRGVLGVLRDGSTGERLLAPQPTYADLSVLVYEAVESGLWVELEDLVAEPVPDAVGRTVYRIVQEGITNVRKHAPGALLTVRVSGSPEEGIELLLRNPIGFGPSHTPGAGLGLVGLAERAELRGGRLDHGREGSTFVLHGWLPWVA